MVARVGTRYESTFTESTFQANIQPLNGADVTARGSGRVDTGSIKIYADAPLNFAKQRATPDERNTCVLFGGDWYEVTEELSYTTGGIVGTLQHYKYIAERRDDAEAA